MMQGKEEKMKNGLIFQLVNLNYHQIKKTSLKNKIYKSSEIYELKKIV